MKIIARNGNAVTNGSCVVGYKPYRSMWGFQQSKCRNETAMYDWIYRCISEGFSVQTRTVGGKTYTVEGGAVDAELFWLVIPLRQFNILANGTEKNITAFNAVFRVAVDNPMLLAFASPVDYTVVNDGGFVDCYKLQFPKVGIFEKKAEMQHTIDAIDDYIFSETGFSVANKPITAAEKQAVATAIHDWILTNVSNNTSYDESGYWTHNAYNCLKSSSPRYSDCSGFAAAYQLLCNMYGINCIYVMGGVGTNEGGATTTKINHAWNTLSLELPIGDYSDDASKWYSVDIRFDQYVKDGKVKTDGVTVTDTKRYFMKDNTYNDTTKTTVNGHDYRQRANNDIGYPVDIPNGGGADA